MTVKELRAILTNYPDDATIFIYNELGECDGLLDRVTYDAPNVEFDMDAGEEFTLITTPHYCQADSEAEAYWSAYGPDKEIVFLHATNTYYDFQYTKEREEILNELSRIRN